MRIQDLDTPVAVVDLERLQANIRRLQAYLDVHGLVNRPHIKTHKIPEIAHMQLEAGAAGITCQKLGEAEVMVAAGIRDIFLPYNLLGPTKLERLMHLTRRARIQVTADSETVVRGYAEAAQAEGTVLPVLVEFDTGTGRCGVQTPQEAADLARTIAGYPSLHFAGLMTYPFNDRTGEFVAATRRLLEAHGLPLETVSIGGTPSMWQAHTVPGATEHRAGTYVYGDRNTVLAGAMIPEACAFHIRTTVVSRPTPERAILDAGSKVLSSDPARGGQGYGQILEYPDAVIYNLSEEHGWVDLSRCDPRPQIGEVVTVLPNHVCVVTNLLQQVVGHRRGEVEVVWPVLARGQVQ